MEIEEEAFRAALVAMSEESLRILITYSLAEQRRRSKISLAKCQEKTQEILSRSERK
jgi:hypothetical protein